jgi:hypothetical protein
MDENKTNLVRMASLIVEKTQETQFIFINMFELEECKKKMEFLENQVKYHKVEKNITTRFVECSLEI